MQTGNKYGIMTNMNDRYATFITGKNDILSFEKIDMQPGMLGRDYVRALTKPFAQTTINGCPYADIIEPFLRIAADVGYVYRRNGFI